MRSLVGSLAVWVCFALLPTTAVAQAVIAGTVRDTSGAILPGVTVEASSPALIEKARVAVSDGTGQYRIEDLRPGTYTVNFALPGFSAYRREGVELTGSFTATINAEMRVGTLAETVTVTGESPIVDVQSARRETVLSSDVLKAIPTVRSYNALVLVVPGVVTNTNDVATGTATTQFPIHGGRNNEGRTQPRRIVSCGGRLQPALAPEGGPHYSLRVVVVPADVEPEDVGRDLAEAVVEVRRVEEHVARLAHD